MRPCPIKLSFVCAECDPFWPWKNCCFLLTSKASVIAPRANLWPSSSLLPLRRCKRLLIDWKARSWQEIWQPEKTLVVGSTEKDRRTCWKFFGQAWRSLSVTTGVHSTGNLIFQRLLFFATSEENLFPIDFSFFWNILMTLPGFFTMHLCYEWWQ